MRMSHAGCRAVRRFHIQALVLASMFGLLFGSFGGETRAQDFLVAAGEEWRFFKGVSEPPPEWVDVDFDDSTWNLGPTRIGYGEGFVYDTVVDEMRNNYVSVYMRRKFEVPDLNALLFLFFDVDYDDGFVAYLNGEEIARDQMEGIEGDRPTFDTTAIGSHTSTVDGGDVEEFLLEEGLLVPGTNVLAVQAHNEDINSQDFSILPRLFSDDLCPQDFTCVYDFEAVTVTLNWRSRTIYDKVQLNLNGQLLIPNIRNAEDFVDLTEGLGCAEILGRRVDPRSRERLAALADGDDIGLIRGYR